ncbi:hypothetical protein ACSQ67_014315 [Phaseolus vulgaris]
MLVFVASSTQLQRIREVGQVMGPTVGIVLEQFSVTTNEPPTLVHRQSCYSPSMAQIAPTLLLRDQRCNSPQFLTALPLGRDMGTTSLCFGHTGEERKDNGPKTAGTGGQFLVIRCKNCTTNK